MSVIYTHQNPKNQKYWMNSLPSPAAIASMRSDLSPGPSPVISEAPALTRRIYSGAVREALVVLWEAADRICGKRLKAVLPDLIAAMERQPSGTRPLIRQHLLTISPATIDRLLRPIRSAAGQHRKRKRTTKSSRKFPSGRSRIGTIPAQGFWRWTSFSWRRLHAGDVLVEPGSDRCMLRVDRGGPIGGPGAVFGRRGLGGDAPSVPGADPRDRHGQLRRRSRRDTPGFLPGTASRIYTLPGLPEERSGLDRAEERLCHPSVRGRPAPLGLGCRSVFISPISDDTIVCQLFSTVVQTPVQDPRGIQVHKRYHKPATPCDRLLARASVSTAAKEALGAELASLDPLEILHQIREGQAALAALSSGDLNQGPEREAWRRFSPSSPGCRARGRLVRTSERGRYGALVADPKGSLRDGVAGDPSVAPARSRVDGEVADRAFATGVPRSVRRGATATFQRRLGEWRRAMARTLVHACLDENKATGNPVVVGAKQNG